MTEELDSLDKVRTEEQSSHITRTAIKLQSQQIDALCCMARLIAQEHVHLMVVVWCTLESPRTHCECLQPPQITDQQLCLRKHKSEGECVDVEEGQQLDAQVLLAWVVHGCEADNTSIDLLLVDDVDLGIAPHTHCKTLVIILHNTAGVHSLQISLFQQLELICRISIVQRNLSVLGLSTETFN